VGRGPPHLVHDSLLCTLRAKILCTPGSAAWAYVPLGLLHGPTCPWVCCMGLRALGSAAWAYVLLGLLRGSMCSWVCCVGLCAPGSAACPHSTSRTPTAPGSIPLPAACDCLSHPLTLCPGQLLPPCTPTTSLGPPHTPCTSIALGRSPLPLLTKNVRGLHATLVHPPCLGPPRSCLPGLAPPAQHKRPRPGRGCTHPPAPSSDACWRDQHAFSGAQDALFGACGARVEVSRVHVDTCRWMGKVQVCVLCAWCCKLFALNGAERALSGACKYKLRQAGCMRAPRLAVCGAPLAAESAQPCPMKGAFAHHLYGCTLKL